MSSEVVIRTTGLCKFYNVYKRPADRLKQMVYRGRRRYYHPVEAVKNLDVEIRRGETFGIVGKNGSGKSTFLQMVCGTVAPSMGTLEVKGKVSALLELGAGFNPEFTGRENVFVCASVMGLSDAEIRERFDQIVAFADIGEFIEQPVKNYSSGMFARLAFAVAIHVDAEILVVDETLSVGDEAFQRKCFARIQQMKEGGCTILFVSHSAGTVMEICDRAMLIDRGERLILGKPKPVVESYQRLIFAGAEDAEGIREEILQGKVPALEDEGEDLQEEASAASTSEDAEQTADLAFEILSQSALYDPHMVPQSTITYAERGCRIVDVGLYDPAGEPANILLMGRPYQLRYRALFFQDCRQVRFGTLIKQLNGWEIGGLVSHPFGDAVPLIKAGEEISVCFHLVSRLVPGTYFANAGIVGMVDGEEVYLHRILDALMFRVDNVSHSRVTGVVSLVGETVCDLEPEK